MGKNKKNKKDAHWGKRLVDVLKEKNLTYRQAAELAEISSHSVIESWSRGSSPNDFIAVKKLCDKLGVSFSWLLTGERQENEGIGCLSEMYDEVQYFNGLARIRIDRLIPKNEKE